MMSSAQSEQKAAALPQAVLDYCLSVMVKVISLEKSQIYENSPLHGQHGRLFNFTVVGGHGIEF